MSDCKIEILDVRFDFRRPDIARCFVLIRARGECEGFLPGWHFSEYRADQLVGVGAGEASSSATLASVVGADLVDQVDERIEAGFLFSVLAAALGDIETGNILEWEKGVPST